MNPLNSASEKLYSNMIEGNKKVMVYRTFPVDDSLATQFTAIDSLDQQVTDTLYIRFEESRRAKEPFNVTVSPKTGTAIEENFKSNIKFNKPVSAINFDSLYIQYDSLNQIPFDPEQHFTWNTYQDELKINIQLDAGLAASLASEAAAAREREKELAAQEQTEQDTIAQQAPNGARPQGRGPAGTTSSGPAGGVFLYAGKGAFISVENDSSANQQLKYAFADPKNFGIIEGRFETSENSYIIQLVQANNFTVVKESRNQQKFQFRFVPPGEYLIRIYIDENENGRWDPGNIHQRIEPEPVIISQEKIVLKANWVIQDISISG